MLTHQILKHKPVVTAVAIPTPEPPPVLSIKTQDQYEEYLRQHPFKVGDLVVSRTWSNDINIHALNMVVYVIGQLKHIKKGHYQTNDPRNLLLVSSFSLTGNEKPKGPRFVEAASAYRHLTEEEERRIVDDNLRNHIQEFKEKLATYTKPAEGGEAG